MNKNPVNHVFLQMTHDYSGWKYSFIMNEGKNERKRP